MILPEIVERFACVFAVADDGLCVIAINDIPCFAEGRRGIWQFAVVDGFEISSAPDALHIKGFKGDSGHVWKITGNLES